MKKLLYFSVILIMAFFVFGCAAESELYPTVDPDENENYVEQNNQVEASGFPYYLIPNYFDILYEFDNEFTIQGKRVFYDTANFNITPETPWQDVLALFLLAEFPSLVSEEARQSAEELCAFLWNDISGLFEISQQDIPSDVFLFIPQTREALRSSSCFGPVLYYFLDLDGDGISELLVAHSVLCGGSTWGYDIYRFIENTYVRLDNLYTKPFIDQLGRIVYIGGISTQLVEIVGDTIVLSEYIDTTGSETFRGIPYSEIGHYSLDSNLIWGYWRDPEDVGMVGELQLKPFPEFDSTDIIEALDRLSQELRLY